VAVLVEVGVSVAVGGSEVRVGVGGGGEKVGVADGSRGAVDAGVSLIATGAGAQLLAAASRIMSIPRMNVEYERFDIKSGTPIGFEKL
jgi:hypothetical protein